MIVTVGKPFGDKSPGEYEYVILINGTQAIYIPSAAICLN